MTQDYARDFTGRGAAACCLGFTSLLFQSLLFQRFYSCSEGGEWSIAVFFFTWLFWVGIGATAGKWVAAPSFPLAAVGLLAYLPAGGLQYYLTDQARVLAGVASYELYGAWRIVMWALAANAPVSLLTGFLFVAISGMAARFNRRAVTQTAVWEALGSCAGGVAFTLMSAAGQSPLRIFLAAAIVIAWVAAFLAASSPARKKIFHGAAFSVSVIVLGLVGSGAERSLMERYYRSLWARLLPAEGYESSFSTPSALYLCGTYGGQFNVMAWNGLVESVPDLEEGMLIARTALAQQPDAGRVLLLGPGCYPAAQSLAGMRRGMEIVWLNPDPLYAEKMLERLPLEERMEPGRLIVPSVVPRVFLERDEVPFDLVIVNMPPGDTYVANSFLTRSFLTLLKSRMCPGGVILARELGNAGYMGEELTLTGASIFQTMCAIWTNVAVADGVAPWLLASDSTDLTTVPAALAQRLAGHGEWQGHTNALWALYDPYRTPVLHERYQRAVARHGAYLDNTLLYPRTPLFATLLMLRKAFPNMPDWADSLPFLVRFLWLVLGGSLLGVCAMRLLAPPSRGWARRGASLLVFGAGFIGISLTVMLLILFQALYGALYVSIGMISALYMLGYFLGGRSWLRLVNRRGPRPALVVSLLLHAFVCIGTALCARAPSLAFFAALFFAAGFSGACMIPVAECLLRRERVPTSGVARRLERMDHLGAALGALLAGLLLIPLVGMSRMLILLGIFPATLILPLCFPLRPLSGGPAMRNVSRIILAIALLAAVGAASQWMARQARDARRTETSAVPRMPEHASDMPLKDGRIAGETWTDRQLDWGNGLLFPYSERFDEATRLHHYRFNTLPLTQGITGYGGPVPMTLIVDEQRRLMDIIFLENHETPEIFAAVRGWSAAFTGENARDPALVDAVTGATKSSEAVRRGIIEAIDRFFSLLQGDTTATEPASGGNWDIPDAPLPGKARNVNANRFREKIGARELSDEPARFVMPREAPP